MASTNNPNRFLRILQWNCLFFTQRKPNLTAISSNYDIISLLETKLSPKSQPSFPNFVMVRKDRIESGGGGGIAILIRKDIPFRIIDSVFHAPLDLETLAISTSSPQGELLTVAVYRPPSRTFDPLFWQRFIDSLSNFSSIFIGGDFNCHNPIWGSSHTCHVGRQIPLYFLDNSFLLLNDGSPTFLNKANAGSPSNIDLSFVSPQLPPVYPRGMYWTIIFSAITSLSPFP